MIDRIAEINHLLITLKTLVGTQVTHAVPLTLLYRDCRAVVYEGRMPRYEETVSFACVLGLVVLVDDSVKLTEVGVLFLSFNKNACYEISDEQAKFLVRKCYFDGPLNKEVLNFFGKFSKSYTWDPSRCLSDSSSTSSDEEWLTAHFLQLGVLRRFNEVLAISDNYQDLVRAFLDTPVGITELQLRELLIEKAEVGAIAEELMLAFERRRLIALGCPVEAECVRRISAERVNAGYDIASFSGPSVSMKFDRFIEVKGARSQSLRFFWTENEMKVAEKLHGQYWIYFQGGIKAGSRSASAEPILFQDPIRSILSDPLLAKASQGMLIQERQSGDNYAR